MRRSVKNIEEDFGPESGHLGQLKGDEILNDGNLSSLSPPDKANNLHFVENAEIEMDQQSSEDDYNDMSSEHDGDFESGPPKTSPEFPGMKHRGGGQKSMKTVSESDDAYLWVGNNWQSTILQPLANFMMSSHVTDKLMAVRSIEKIIQLCG